jgi:hypothetical protein
MTDDQGHIRSTPRPAARSFLRRSGSGRPRPGPPGGRFALRGRRRVAGAAERGRAAAGRRRRHRQGQKSRRPFGRCRYDRWLWIGGSRLMTRGCVGPRDSRPRAGALSGRWYPAGNEASEHGIQVGSILSGRLLLLRGRRGVLIERAGPMQRIEPRAPRRSVVPRPAVRGRRRGVRRVCVGSTTRGRPGIAGGRAASPAGVGGAH